jgi:hypothetical protein
MNFKQQLTRGLILVVPLIILLLLLPTRALAHCDGLDGPVVKAAQKAIESGDVNLVLVWVQKKDEIEIRQAFARTLSVRKLSPAAQELADRYFFETVVRIHRAGEGEPYTGLKPAGRDLGPAIPLADQALTDGRVVHLVTLITDETRKGLIERFENARKAKSYVSADVEAGRKYVEAYVQFIHYAERVYEAGTKHTVGHSSDAEPSLEKHDNH